MERHELEGLTREELIALAEELGVARPRSLTVPELVDEIVTRTARSERDRARSRGWMGRARDLLAGVIERGLHLPDVVSSVRSTPAPAKGWPTAPPPLATVTLAEIYAAQGFVDKAIGVLDEVLAREPEHTEARVLRQRLTTGEVHEDAVTTPIEAEAEAQTQAEAEAQTQAEAEAQTQAEAEAIEEAEAEPVAPVAIAKALVEAEAEAIAEAAAEAELEAWSAPEADAIDELPLPERYDVDEVVAIAVDPATIYLYWEVRPVSLARARARHAGGALVVRMVQVTPSWDGPILEQRDLHIDALFGDAYLRNLRPGSNVRVSIGWLAHGAFEPFAIGAEVMTSRSEPTTSVSLRVARWSPERSTSGPVGAAGEEPTRAHVAGPAPAEIEAMLGPILAGPSAGAPTTGGAGRFEAIGERVPTLDFGDRGAPAGATRPGAQARGGSSEWPRGGASEQVRPGTRER
ncbi:DUF4912 domain-containing protein [Polyangium spumosum]|nr:DUF4912 domain-containing protein [Polyangium spumosum]